MEGTTMLSNITTAFTTAMGWIGEVITGLTSGELSELGVLFGIGVAMAIIGGSISLIKRVIWGA